MTVQNSAALQEALVNAKDMDEMIAAFADQGIEVTAEQLEQASKATLEELGDELGESDLDGVTGGFGKWNNYAADCVGRAALNGFQTLLNFIGSYI